MSPLWKTSAPAWLPYVAPMAAFLALTSVEGALGDDWYPWLYAAKVALVSGIAWASRSTWRDLGPWPPWPVALAAVGLGALVTLVWVGADGLVPPLPGTGARTAYDPGTLDPGPRAAFLAVRLFGLVVLVPLIEELFWRSFLMRIVDAPDWRDRPVGAVTWKSALVTSALFALAHPEWLPALLTGLAWAALLARTRSLAACAISHAVANALLGAYVLATGAWRFW